MAGSLSDMNALLGTLQATNAMSDGQASQLAALQEAVVSSMHVVETEMDKLHAQTQAQLERYSADKAKLIAEKEHALASQLVAEEEARILRDRLSEKDARNGTESDVLMQARAELERTCAALAKSEYNEGMLHQQLAVARQEAEDVRGQCVSLRGQFDAEVAAALQLRKELELVKSENKAMRERFAARLEDMARQQDRLRAKQHSLDELARDG